MSAAHVRRGSPGSRRSRKPSRGKVTVPKKLADRLPVKQESANRLARWMFGLFAAGAAALALVALDVPAKLGTAAGEAVGEAGFRVRSVDVQGIHRMDSKPVFEIAVDQKSMAMPLVDVAAIRERLLHYGWVKDARVSRRLPDTLVIDIVEREPAALWQDQQKLSLIDAEGVVLDRVPISAMPDLPLLIGPGANAQSRHLDALLAEVPTLRPQLESASWVGKRRWDLHFQSGETVALPEGTAEAKAALSKLAKLDKSSGVLGRGIVRIDLRIPGKMVVRLPRAPGEPIVPEPPSEG
ncbi:MAG TPA: cell division protein FtsQ/DivIB [Sphingomicrobium sp.]|nr:cell division protein FtsQ/DivIB [Sphingomicrobium sp.]